MLFFKMRLSGETFLCYSGKLSIGKCLFDQPPEGFFRFLLRMPMVFLLLRCSMGIPPYKKKKKRNYGSLLYNIISMTIMFLILIKYYMEYKKKKRNYGSLLYNIISMTIMFLILIKYYMEYKLIHALRILF